MSIKVSAFALTLLFSMAFGLPISQPEPEELPSNNNFEPAAVPGSQDENVMNPLLIHLLNSIGNFNNDNQQSPQIVMPRMEEPLSPWAKVGEDAQDSPLPEFLSTAFGNRIEIPSSEGNEMPTNPLVSMYYMKIGPSQPENQKFFDVNAAENRLASGNTFMSMSENKGSVVVTPMDSVLTNKAAQFVDNQGMSIQEPRRVDEHSAECQQDWTWRQIWMSLLSICVFAQTIMLIYISKDVERMRMSRIEKL